MRSPLLVLSLLSIVALSSPASAQSFVVTVDEARLFQGAAVDSGVIARLPFDTVAELVGCRVSWCEIELDGVRGFVQQRAVTPTDRRPARRQASPPMGRAPAEGAAHVDSADEHVDERAGEGRTAERPLPAPPSPATLPPHPARGVALAPERASAAQQRRAPASGRANAAQPIPPPPPQAQPPPPPRPVAAPPAAAPDGASAPAPPAAPVPSRPQSPSGALKSTATGTLASLLLPGGGHLYAGERGAGALLLVLSAAAPTAGYLASDRTGDPNCVSPGPGVACTDTTDYGPLFVGIAVASVAWVAGLLDARNAVRRANERVANGRSATDVSVRPVAEAGYAGVSLRVAL